jgi:hypothetical protein
MTFSYLYLIIKKIRFTWFSPYGRRSSETKGKRRVLELFFHVQDVTRTAIHVSPGKKGKKM